MQSLRHHLLPSDAEATVPSQREDSLRCLFLSQQFCQWTLDGLSPDGVTLRAQVQQVRHDLAGECAVFL